MNKTRMKQARCARWHGVCAGLALAALLVRGHAQPAVQADVAQAQPALLQLAAQRPATMVQVIVQEQGPDRGVKALAARLGGRVTKDLSIIHAFAATLPARAVPQIARDQGVRWVSLDAGVANAAYYCCTTTNLNSVYAKAIGAAQLRTGSSALTGQGIGVAVVDSGYVANNDLDSHVVAQTNVNPIYHHHTTDLYGHGVHVAGIVAGDGTNSNGAYVGVAPQASLVMVRVADDNGASTVSDVVNGLQWVYDNAATYNIRVVNLSLNSTVNDSYQVDPLDAAVETLWKVGIVVVVSAGNAGTANAGVLYAPANDPFAITVGAVNDQGTVSTSSHMLASFSSYGTLSISTTAGQTINISKPNLVAPGVNIVSDLASTSDTLATAHPDHIVRVNGCTCYFRMSGTSMAAPMVTGAVALLLQANPTLTPDQVKYRLMSTAQAVGTKTGAGAGEVNVAAAIKSTSTASANSGYAWAASIQAGNPAANWVSASWGSASWGATSWTLASWGSASWGSASWGSASWGSDYWST